MVPQASLLSPNTLFGGSTGLSRHHNVYIKNTPSCTLPRVQSLELLYPHVFKFAWSTPSVFRILSQSFLLFSAPCCHSSSASFSLIVLLFLVHIHELTVYESGENTFAFCANPRMMLTLIVPPLTFPDQISSGFCSNLL